MLSKFTYRFHIHSASLLLTLLLCTDLAFISTNIIEKLSPSLDNQLFSIQSDYGYPEVFQYIKWFWIILLLAYLSIPRRELSLNLSQWCLFFTCLLIDDSLKIHENLGSFIASFLTVTPPFNLRLQDLGELIVVGFSGLILLAFILWGYIRGSIVSKVITRDLLLLVILLTFFGVAADMAHSAIPEDRRLLSDFFVLIEDGGEMIVASLICWYVFLLAVKGPHHTTSIFYFARSVLHEISTHIRACLQG